MLAAMTHPSRVLNLDMKAKLYIYIYIYIYGFFLDIGQVLFWLLSKLLYVFRHGF